MSCPRERFTPQIRSHCCGTFQTSTRSTQNFGVSPHQLKNFLIKESYVIVPIPEAVMEHADEVVVKDIRNLLKQKGNFLIESLYQNSEYYSSTRQMLDHEEKNETNSAVSWNNVPTKSKAKERRIQTFFNEFSTYIEKLPFLRIQGIFFFCI